MKGKVILSCNCAVPQNWSLFEGPYRKGSMSVCSSQESSACHDRDARLLHSKGPRRREGLSSGWLSQKIPPTEVIFHDSDGTELAEFLGFQTFQCSAEILP